MINAPANGPPVSAFVPLRPSVSVAWNGFPPRFPLTDADVDGGGVDEPGLLHAMTLARRARRHPSDSSAKTVLTIVSARQPSATRARYARSRPSGLRPRGLRGDRLRKTREACRPEQSGFLARTLASDPFSRMPRGPTRIADRTGSGCFRRGAPA
jgi:hypothetical protein